VLIATNIQSMNRSGVFYLIFLIFLPAIVFSQDTIFFVKQYQYVVKVIEIEDSKVKYRKFDNLEGPLYSVAKNEILSIHYSNGTRDTFNVAGPAIGEKQLEKNDY
jgi:hypothetical protein